MDGMRSSGGIALYATALPPPVNPAVFPRLVEALVGKWRTSCAMPRPSCGSGSFGSLAADGVDGGLRCSAKCSKPSTGLSRDAIEASTSPCARRRASAGRGRQAVLKAIQENRMTLVYWTGLLDRFTGQVYWTGLLDRTTARI